jgi:hypothetical protein
LFNKVKEFIEMDDMSRLSSYETSKKGNVFTPVRYMNTTIKEAYLKFIKEYDLSESSFRKILRQLKHIRKPKRQTDKCEMCVCGKKIESKINNLKIMLNNSKVSRSEKKKYIQS